MDPIASVDTRVYFTLFDVRDTIARMTDVRGIVEWLVNGARGAPTPMEVIEKLGPDLNTAGVPVDRIMTFVRTLHPHITGRRFRWLRGEKVVVDNASYALFNSPTFLASPLAEVIRTGVPLRQRLAVDDRFATNISRELRDEGFTDYYVAPMIFLSGQVHPMTFATKRPEGFSDEHIAALDELIPPLARIGEIFALQRTAATLLSTYVGRNAGDRIMAGQIQRGDTDSLRAIIWFSDLRGFTALSDRVPPSELIAILNELFECQVPAIEQHGGEVLKFIGDGLLAIFPILSDGKTPEEQVESAILASDEAFQALEARNVAAREKNAYELKFGLALHLGEIVYGNIGGAGRLDFTCIGTAVNVAARLEAVASKLGRARVVSADIAKLTKRETERLGDFELKGVTLPQGVFSI